MVNSPSMTRVLMLLKVPRRVGQVPRVLLDPRVPQRQDLIRRRRQPHGAAAVYLAVFVHVAAGQFKFKFRFHTDS